MKKEIKAVHDYFRTKLIKGQYDIIDITGYTVRLLIDNKYKFCIWLANGEFSIACYEDHGHPCFMEITFRVSDKSALWGKLNKPFTKYKKEIVLISKTEELEKLRLELGL